MKYNPFLLSIFFLFFSCLSLPAFSETFEEGHDAYLAEDYTKALAILTSLAKQGHANAQVTLGIMYDFGHGVDKDPQLAIQWYEKAAEQGNAVVQHDLGVKYFRGLGVNKDYKKAGFWWQKAAENNVAESQYNLGLMYARGLGFKKDNNKAVQWYQQAADQDHAHAQYSLAVMYAFGQGTEQDYNKAFSYFQKSADQGVSQSQFNLAVLLEKGRGTAVDIERARYWYQKAADQGLEQASQKLAMLPPPKAQQPVVSTGNPSENKITDLPTPTATTIAPESNTIAHDDNESIVQYPDTSNAGILREKWIQQQNPDAFTLQLIALSREDSILNFLDNDQLTAAKAYYASQSNGKTLYRVIYGVYDTQASARKAIQSLPGKLKNSNPIVRQFSSIQDSLID